MKAFKWFMRRSSIANAFSKQVQYRRPIDGIFLVENNRLRAYGGWSLEDGDGNCDGQWKRNTGTGILMMQADYMILAEHPLERVLCQSCAYFPLQDWRMVQSCSNFSLWWHPCAAHHNNARWDCIKFTHQILNIFTCM